MAENSLFPCSAVIQYTGVQGTHKMTLPLNEWSPISGGHPLGTTLAWDTSQKDTEDMIDGFITLLLPFLDNTAEVQAVTIYTYDEPEAPARPRAAKTYAGQTGSGGTVIPAAQQSINLRTEDFGQSRIVILDSVVSANFAPKRTITLLGDPDEWALTTYFGDVTNGFAGRDGARPGIFGSITYTLNEKLRREYRLD